MNGSLLAELDRFGGQLAFALHHLEPQGLCHVYVCDWPGNPPVPAAERSRPGLTRPEPPGLSRVYCSATYDAERTYVEPRHYAFDHRDHRRHFGFWRNCGSGSGHCEDHLLYRSGPVRHFTSDARYARRLRPAALIGKLSGPLFRPRGSLPTTSVLHDRSRRRAVLAWSPLAPRLQQ